MKKICIYLIEFYQKYITKIKSKNIKCKFYPTCSEYTKQAINKYGVIKGRKTRDSKDFKMQSFF